VPCVPTPCLAQAALKKLSCDQLYSLSGGCLVFLPGTDSCGRSRIFVRSPHADTPCLASWHLPLPCLLAPCLSWPCLASWCLAMPCLPWAPILRTCLAMRLGAHLADVPCVALGRPTSVRPYQKVYLQAKICSYPSSSSSFSLVLPCVDVFVADEIFVWATILRNRLALRLGAHLADAPCVALGRPTLVRPY
jgi:hypothetical protein